MKKTLLYLTTAIFLLASCKKSTKTGGDIPPGKTYNVNFTANLDKSLTATNQNKLKVNAVSNLTAAVASKFWYIVYDSNGNFVDQVVQTPAVSNFGSVGSNLKAGTYTIIMAAGASKLKFVSDGGNPLIYTLNGTYITYDDFTAGSHSFIHWGDTFYKKFSVTVTDANINQNVSLERIVGQLQIKITDTIPTSAKTIKCTLSDNDLMQNAATLVTYRHRTIDSYTITLPDSVKGKTGQIVFNQIVSNVSRPFSVKFYFADANGFSIARQVTVNNVTCQKNTRTILSGQLFTVNSGFQISLNATWDPVPFTTVNF